MDETLLLMPNVLLLGDPYTRKIYLWINVTCLKRSKNANENLSICKKKVVTAQIKFFCCWVMNRQFMQHNSFGIITKNWTMDIKISRTQTPKSQIQPKAAITKKHQTTVLPWTVFKNQPSTYGQHPKASGRNKFKLVFPAATICLTRKQILTKP